MGLDEKPEENENNSNNSNNSNVLTKYIQIKHLDYWASLYGIDENKTEDLSWVEINISNDSAGNEQFYWLEFSNIAHCTGGDFYFGSEADKTSLLLHKMLAGEIDFFVNRAIYPHNEKVFAPETFENSTIFDHRHMESPHYIHVALNENRPLTPEVLVEWLNKLSKPFFGEQFDFEVTIDYTKMGAEKAYIDSLNNDANNYNKFFTGEYFIKVSDKGMADFKLGSFMGEIANSANFPIVCCEAFINLLNGKLPIIIDFEEEFTQFTLVIDSYNRVYIVSHQFDETHFHDANIVVHKLINLFLNDMKRDLEIYKNDNFYYGEEADKEKWGQEFQNKLENIEELLNNYRG